MSRLEALPQHIRRDILRYLLLSDRVRGPPNRHLIEDYDFQVAVLRTSKAINQEAAKVFHGDNKWIKLHNGYGTTIENALLNHEVPYFKLGTKKFDNHVAEVKVDPNYQRKATGKYGGKTTVGVLLLQDMPKLARALRILDFANFMGYDFKFALHKPPGTVSTLGREDQERFALPMGKGKLRLCESYVSNLLILPVLSYSQWISVPTEGHLHHWVRCCPCRESHANHDTGSRMATSRRCRTLRTRPFHQMRG